MSCTRKACTLIDMLFTQARLGSDHVAILSDERSITYAELVNRATIIGYEIARTNQRESDCVGVFIDASDEMIIAVWGIIWSSKGYLPISTDYPDDRISFIISNSGVDTILTQAHLASRLREIVPSNLRIIILEEIEGTNHFAERPSASLASLAYVIYTSGSTGRPKGVEIEQRAIVNQMEWLSQAGLLKSGDKVLQKTPISFDAAQWEILAPAVGATVVSGAPNLYRDVSAIIEKINRHNVTHLQCVPTLLTGLMEEERFLECKSLEYLFSGGEPLTRKLAQTVASRLNQAVLINLYGPTECTINATSHRLTVGDLTGGGNSISIGRPVSGVSCSILDDSMKPVPRGSEGELYLSGVQLARGYRNDPDQTTARFVSLEAVEGLRAYRTGDRCRQEKDGSISFIGRTDHQVKFRGYRIELEEIAAAIESHPWVRHAAVVVAHDGITSESNLIACVELSEKEAALMDQGTSGSHHRSKSDRAQVKAQLSSQGLRDPDSDTSYPHIALPGASPSEEQIRQVFRRKTYRFYDGGKVSRNELQDLLAEWEMRIARKHCAPDPLPLDRDRLGALLRWMGRFDSRERLLPKYSYASPGALYSVQLYVECGGITGIPDGIHYYDPLRHLLVHISSGKSATDGVRFHFSGKRSAIEPVYKNNLLEVLEMEAGHMLGVLDENLAKYGLAIGPGILVPDMQVLLRVSDEDFYLGTFGVVPHTNGWKPAFDVYLQAQLSGTEDLDVGTLYAVQNDTKKVAEEIIRRQDVIAINQSVYDRASIGISLVSRQGITSFPYTALGFGLHAFQQNSKQFGFMPSGYSSKTGNPLPASRRLDRILSKAGMPVGAMYFFVGGKISDAQAQSRGMSEDLVHMQGPAEIILGDLKNQLPNYMVPSRVVILDRLPLAPNGKVNIQQVRALDILQEKIARPVFQKPETPVEIKLSQMWCEMFGLEAVSAGDDFFSIGGNSLVAVSMLHRINQEFKIALPVQTIFEAPHLKELAKKISSRTSKASSRCVLLNKPSKEKPIFCWPGLGGYPMNLRPLAQNVSRPFYGIQSLGLNKCEQLLPNITGMAEADRDEINRIQEKGTLSLWGYSFGARLAFETAWQLEAMGREVDQVVLICPGNPILPFPMDHSDRSAHPRNPAFIAILLSVFFGKIDLSLSEECLRRADDFEAVATFVSEARKEIPLDVVRRIIELVIKTYEFEYNFLEIEKRAIKAPVCIVKASGDDYSFLERSSDLRREPAVVLHVSTDHYSILRDPHAAGLARLIERSAPIAPWVDRNVVEHRMMDRA